MANFTDNLNPGQTVAANQIYKVLMMELLAKVSKCPRAPPLCSAVITVNEMVLSYKQEQQLERI